MTWSQRQSTHAANGSVGLGFWRRSVGVSRWALAAQQPRCLLQQEHASVFTASRGCPWGTRAVPRTGAPVADSCIAMACRGTLPVAWDLGSIFILGLTYSMARSAAARGLLALVLSLGEAAPSGTPIIDGTNASLHWHREGTARKREAPSNGCVICNTTEYMFLHIPKTGGGSVSSGVPTPVSTL